MRVLTLLHVFLLLSLLHTGSSRRKTHKGGSDGPRRGRAHATTRSGMAVDPRSGWPAADANLAAAAAAMGLLEPRRCDFPSIDGTGLSAQNFAREYLRKAPVVLRGLMDSWPAHQGGWTREALLAQHGDAPVTHAQASDVAQFGPKEGGSKSFVSKLRDWVAATMDSTDDSHAPLAFDRSGGNVAYRLFQQVSVCHTDPFALIPLYETDLSSCHCVQGDFTPPAVLAPGAMDQMLISLGPPRAGLPLHTHGDSWLALTHGSKLWLVFPPQWGASSAAAAYKLLALRPAAAIIAENLLASLADDEQPLICVQQPGEIVYLPALWWHATVNLDGAVGVGAQNDVVDYTPGTDAGLEALVAGNPQSGRALYQAAAHFLSSGHDAAGLERGWLLFESALAAEPLNFNYWAALARAGGALEAVGRALPAGMLRPSEALLGAASRVRVAVDSGVYSKAEATESLCNLVIAGFDLEDYETTLAIADQALQLDPAHHSTLNRAALGALFSGKKKLALRYLGIQMQHARDSEEKDYLNGFGNTVFQMPDEPAAFMDAVAEMKKSLRRE